MGVSTVSRPPRVKEFLIFDSYRIKSQGKLDKDFLYTGLIILFTGISLLFSWQFLTCAGILLGLLFYHKNIFKSGLIVPATIREDVSEEIGIKAENTVTVGIMNEIPVKAGAVGNVEFRETPEKIPGGKSKKWQKRRRNRRKQKKSAAPGRNPVKAARKIEGATVKPIEAVGKIEDVVAKAIDSIRKIEETVVKPVGSAEKIEETIVKAIEAVGKIEEAAAKTIESIGKIEKAAEKAIAAAETATAAARKITEFSEATENIQEVSGEKLKPEEEAERIDVSEPQAPEEVVLPINENEEDRVSYLLNPFIPREFLNILHKNTALDLKLGDHIKREMTIFFSDIRDFTTLSEDLTPEESFKFINSYLTRIVPVIEKHGGFVDKYIGDAILALYPQANGADMAVQTAIEIQEKLLEYNIHRAKSGYRPLAMGIGLHTGTLMLGVVGVNGRMQNTVISDAVNLASRLESMTKAFNISMAISEQTFKKLEDPGSYMYRFIGQVRVKGKAEPVSVYEILNGINPEIMDKKMKANRFFEEGMLSFKRKYYAEAKDNFEKVLEILPDDGASIFYKEYCEAKIVPA
ncbi:MAG: adenylate/guanylate cyclase domain-containing protein [Treponema sp.]|nr:adenylate/guanylate cyclase domain-containing protein [Treponema sp.]